MQLSDDFLLLNLPDWSNNLRNYYWVIRNERFNSAKRRRYYRMLEKEKLRLAESGIDQQLILAICRYYCDLKPLHARKVANIIQSENKQLSFNF